MSKLLDNPIVSNVFYIYWPIVLVFTIGFLFYKKFSFVRVNIFILILSYLILNFNYYEFLSKNVSPPPNLSIETMGINLLFYNFFLYIVPIIGIIIIITCMIVPVFEILILLFNINIHGISNTNRQNNIPRNKNLN